MRITSSTPPVLSLDERQDGIAEEAQRHDEHHRVDEVREEVVDEPHELPQRILSSEQEYVQAQRKREIEQRLNKEKPEAVSADEKVQSESVPHETSKESVSDEEKGQTELQHKELSPEVIENHDASEKKIDEKNQEETPPVQSNFTIKTADTRPLTEILYSFLDTLVVEIDSQSIDAICEYAKTTVDFSLICKPVEENFGKSTERGQQFLRFLRHSSTYIASDLHERHKEKLDKFSPDNVGRAVALHSLSALITLFKELEEKDKEKLQNYCNRNFV